MHLHRWRWKDVRRHRAGLLTDARRTRGSRIAGVAPSAYSCVARHAGFLLLIPAYLAPVLAGSALLGASLSWIIAGIMTLFQRRTPPELMGRTDAAFTFCYAVPQTVAIAAGAGLIAVLSYQLTLLIIVAVMTLAAGYLATRREEPLRTLAGVPDSIAARQAADTVSGDSCVTDQIQ
jgi:hypothetical protein